jgi:uncharacterized membrane protein
MSQPLSLCEKPETMVAITFHDATTLTEKLSEETENGVLYENYDGGKKCCNEGNNTLNDEYFPPNRMTHYTDSIMASSKLFLALPALKAITDAEADGLEGAEFLQESMYALPSFALSFTLISMYWRTHNELFRHVTSCTSTIEVYNNLFLFVIASLPITSFAKETVLPPFVFVLNLMLVNIVLVALHMAIRKELFVIDSKNVPNTSFGIFFLSASFIILSTAMVIICIVPDPKILLMLFSLPFMKPLTRYMNKKYDMANGFATWIDSSLQRGGL